MFGFMFWGTIEFIWWCIWDLRLWLYVVFVEAKIFFHECFNDNKPRGINDKFYEWWSTNIWTWVFIKRTGITQVDKLEATHIDRCIISTQQRKNEYIISWDNKIISPWWFIAQKSWRKNVHHKLHKNVLEVMWQNSIEFYVIW